MAASAWEGEVADAFVNLGLMEQIDKINAEEAALKTCLKFLQLQRTIAERTMLREVVCLLVDGWLVGRADGRRVGVCCWWWWWWWR